MLPHYYDHSYILWRKSADAQEERSDICMKNQSYGPEISFVVKAITPEELLATLKSGIVPI
jgi:hypothetical protein